MVGGSGFLGREIVRQTRCAGHRVAATFHDETCLPDPTTPYGAAKAAAETAVAAITPDAVIARTSLIIGYGESVHERHVHALAAGPVPG